MKSVTDNKYWSDHWVVTSYDENFKKHPICIWLDKTISKTDGKSAFEVGCFPGKFLALLGEKGYGLNGIDKSAGLNFMKGWLLEKDLKVGNLIESDFLEYKSNLKYDLVCSFGFIEHFTNWQKIIEKHLELTKTGGLCVIEVPNLKSPIYHLLYRFLEPRVLKNHVLDAMSKRSIVNYLTQLNVEIVSADYLGNFYFRFVTKKGNKYQSIEKIINTVGSLFNFLPNCLSSRYMGIIVKKN